MDNRLSVQNHLVPVSFMTKTQARGVRSVELIIELLTQSVMLNMPITRTEIKELYWVYKTVNETVAIEQWEWNYKTGKQNVGESKEAFLNHWQAPFYKASY